jgi:hypothetical protein
MCENKKSKKNKKLRKCPLSAMFSSFLTRKPSILDIERHAVNFRELHVQYAVSYIHLAVTNGEFLGADLYIWP